MARRDEQGYLRFIAYLGESGLEPSVRGICLRHATTPRDIYLDTQGPTITAARLEVWWWLTVELGKSAGEIGLIFDRNQGSIRYALRRLGEAAVAMGAELDRDRVEAVARNLAQQRTLARVEHGRRLLAADRKKAPAS